MNLSWKTLFISFTLLLGMLSPMLAQGSCDQVGLRGTWYTYGMVDDSYSYTSATISCKIALDKSGVIDGGKCHVVSAYGSSDIKVKGGSILVKNASTCAIKGQIKIKGEIGYTYLGSTKIIFSGTVASDEKTYYATGYVQDYPSIITHLTGAKQ